MKFVWFNKRAEQTTFFIVLSGFLGISYDDRSICPGTDRHHRIHDHNLYQVISFVRSSSILIVGFHHLMRKYCCFDHEIFNTHIHSESCQYSSAYNLLNVLSILIARSHTTSVPSAPTLCR